MLENVTWFRLVKDCSLRDFTDSAPYVGVKDGARTRNNRDHNPVLYQLNYQHHLAEHKYHFTSASGGRIVFLGLTNLLPPTQGRRHAL